MRYKELKESLQDDIVEKVVEIRMSEFGNDSGDEMEARVFHDMDPYGDGDEELSQEMIRDYIENEVWDAFYTFKNMATGNHIEAWRVITVPKDTDFETLKQNHLGVFWSYEKWAAEAHWGDENSDTIKIRLHANLPLSSINWIGTLVQASNRSYDEEKEIRIKNDAPYTLLGIEKL